uniref:Probable WRKY transcription factor 32 n=1 Tax=Tanacetum cinerariifolium TaxID=118510 RepID=A0A699GIW7_TANCI|nr:probable WRKY transcription factor 32 [Tanacetum cinerariifolium]
MDDNNHNNNEETTDQSSEATHNFEIIHRQNHDVSEQEQHSTYNNHYTHNEYVDDDLDDEDYEVTNLPIVDDDVEYDDDDERMISSYVSDNENETLASSGLADVPVRYEMRQDELEHLKNQLQGSHQEALAIVIAQASQSHTGNIVQLPLPSTPISTLPRINKQRETLSAEGASVNVHVAEGNKIVSSDPKTVSNSRTVKTPIDGFNWRKYGQKQVKSPQGSRSYYKCTHNECDAKKLESSDQNNFITKIVYKGQHKHDPPKKVISRRGKILSASSKAQERRTISTLGPRQYKSSGSVSNGLILVEEMDAPPPKKRVKKNTTASPGSVLKRPKKPKFVIHAASDVGISADGYRWRKYGQKMVKGNPHPRNYYKCTSAGCPVRKHIEMAVDGSSEVILTYKGIHDHDMPIRTKEQGSPTVLLLDAVSSPSKNNSQSRRGESEASNGVADV